MLTTRLIQILHLLERDEFKRFGQFLNSPYHNIREKPVDLFNYLYPFFPEFNDPALDKSKVFRALFPQKPYNDTKLRQVMSYTTKKLEEFIAIENNYDEDNPKNLQLLSFLRKRSDAHLFGLYWKTIMNQYEQQQSLTEEVYLRRFQFEAENTRHIEQLSQEKSRLQELNLSSLGQNLDHYYIISKLKLYCDVLNYRNITGDTPDLLLMDEILNHIQQNDYSHVPGIAIYYNIIQTLLNNENESNFTRLKKLLSNYAYRFERREARRMYGMAQNFCIKKINSGQDNYLEELFEIFQKLLHQKIIFGDDGKLSPWDFKNIVTVAVRLGRLNWTETFIEQYHHYIEEEEKTNAYTYNRAKLAYHQGDYSKVLDLLNQVTYNDIFYNLDSRVLLIKTYYELNEVVALDSAISSLNTFLNRKKRVVADYQRQLYSNFSHFVKQLSSLSINSDKEVQKLSSKLQNTNLVADKGWLQKQVALLASTN
ncbi:MAG: hypothetical protein BRD50_08275 [Bacteroidetes bacterium SW_11_45_7]|nr:MAG: hypothetical protein BRD50_08275 [Bacteroidetes bacterium SW_11_45_7]